MRFSSDALRVNSDGVARDPDEVLSELLFGFLGTQLLYVVSELRIADLIGSEPETIDLLASRAGASPDVLYRFLRALAALGVFVEVEDRAFAQTPTSAMLRSDPGSGWHEVCSSNTRSSAAWSSTCQRLPRRHPCGSRRRR